MTALDLDEIERLALAATPGPWFHAYCGVFSEPAMREEDRLIDAGEDDAPSAIVAHLPALAGDTATPRAERDGAHIASMSPSTTLALVAEVRRLRAAVEGFAEHDCAYGDGCPENAGTRHGTCVGCQARAALTPPEGEP